MSSSGSKTNIQFCLQCLRILYFMSDVLQGLFLWCLDVSRFLEYENAGPPFSSVGKNLARALSLSLICSVNTIKYPMFWLQGCSTCGRSWINARWWRKRSCFMRGLSDWRRGYADSFSFQGWIVIKRNRWWMRPRRVLRRIGWVFFVKLQTE